MFPEYLLFTLTYGIVFRDNTIIKEILLLLENNNYCFLSEYNTSVSDYDIISPNKEIKTDKNF